MALALAHYELKEFKTRFTAFFLPSEHLQIKSLFPLWHTPLDIFRIGVSLVNISKMSEFSFQLGRGKNSNISVRGAITKENKKNWDNVLNREEG